MAIFGVGGQHLAGDLGVARFVRTHQPKLAAAEVGQQPEEQKITADEQQNGELGNGAAEFGAAEAAQIGEEAGGWDRLDSGRS
jgi:hypothetical protein